MKKGFTLTELLGVIVVLGIIALIITPVITSTIIDTEEKIYKKQVDVIESVAKEWGIENPDYLPEIGSSSSKAISLETLINSGKIQNSSIIDPRTEEEMTGCVVVSYNSEYSQYEYKYEGDNDKCDSVTLCKYIGTDETKKYDVGAKYKCTLGENANSKNLIFYILESGTKPASDSKLETNEFALIKEGNYDTTIQSWCASGSNNSCNADGLTDKLNNIHLSWNKLNREQIGIPSAVQIAEADGQTFDSTIGFYISASNAWLYNWPGNDDYNNGIQPVGYWTSTPSSIYFQAKSVLYHNSISDWDVNLADKIGVRPVITIPVGELG